MNYVSYDNATAIVTPIGTKIRNTQSMIANAFDSATAYVIGDVVRYNDVLYRFKAAHSAGAWIGTDVDAVNVIELLDDVEVSALTTAEVNALIALL